MFGSLGAIGHQVTKMRHRLGEFIFPLLLSRNVEAQVEGTRAFGNLSRYQEVRTPDEHPVDPAGCSGVIQLHRLPSKSPTQNSYLGTNHLTACFPNGLLASEHPTGQALQCALLCTSPRFINRWTKKEWRTRVLKILSNIKIVIPSNRKQARSRKTGNTPPHPNPHCYSILIPIMTLTSPRQKDKEAFLRLRNE
jgi:hypothetical protein